PRLGEAFSTLDPLGKAEIRHVGLASGIEEDVCRLEVSMEDAVLVCVMNGARHGLYEIGCPALRCGAANQPLIALRGLREIATSHELHREVVLTLAFADFVNGDNI